MKILNSRSTRILITVSYYYPNISGLTIYSKRLAGGMVKKGFDVVVLTSHHKKELAVSERDDGVKIKRVWTPFLLGRGPIVPTYIFESFLAVANVDVVNCHLPQFEAIIPAIWTKLLRKRLILTYHCDLSGWSGLVNRTTEKVTFLSHLVTGLLADKIVCYTKDYTDSSRYLKLFKNKLVYLLPPVEVEKPDTEFKSMSKFRNIKYKIGFAGRITKEKGLTYLLEAIPYLRKYLTGGFKIYLAGPSKDVVGMSHFMDEIHNLINKYKDYLVFLGPLDGREMARFYKNIDVLILPSTEKIESFGLVQVEAMLSGCPVIAADMPGVRVPVKLSGMGELVPVKNSKAIAERVVRVLKNREKYVKPVEKIKQIFNYQKTMDTYEQLFKNIS